jgi:hypothetical protein
LPTTNAAKRELDQEATEAEATLALTRTGFRTTNFSTLVLSLLCTKGQVAAWRYGQHYAGRDPVRAGCGRLKARLYSQWSG